MALCHCIAHAPEPSRTQYAYAGYAEPIDFPNRAIRCTLMGCDAFAVVWLTVAEAELYRSGERRFQGTSKGFVVIAVGDGGIHPAESN